MNQHSPEPWKPYICDFVGSLDKGQCCGYEDGCGNIFHHTDSVYECGHTVDLEDMRRACACVNACRHLSTDYLEWLAAEERFLVGTSLRDIAATVAKFEQIVGEGRAKELAPLYGRVVRELLEEFADEKNGESG